MHLKRKILPFFLSMGILSQLFGSSGNEANKSKPGQPELRYASRESLERQSRTEAFLSSKRIPINTHLPAIEDSSSSKLRAPQEIAERLVACTAASIAGETGDPELIDRVLSKLNARPLLSPQERKFIETGMKDQQKRIQFSWRYERCWVLLWALGYVDHLSYPPAVCDMPKLVQLLQNKSAPDLLKNAHPRSLKEVLDEADLIYRLDWAVVDERVNAVVKVPDEIDRGVVVERHTALNWLINYLDQDWDDITTDT